jgi:hypothetical protein
MTEFAKLLEELNTSENLIKAMPAPTDEDAKVKAAAAEGGAGTDAPEPEPGAGDPAEEEDPEMMGKSFTVMIDGKPVEVFDGSELVKSLVTKYEGLTGIVERVIGMNTSLVERVKHGDEMIAGQGALIKSLQGQVAAFGNTGTGRKAVLNLVDKTPAPAAAAETPSYESVMAKAESLHGQGVFTGVDVSRTANYLRKGQPLPADLAQALAH